MLIQVDVDSTLYDANAIFKKVALSPEFNVQWPNRYYKWFGPEDIGTDLTTLKAIFRKCHSRDIVKLQKPYPHAAEVLQGIASDFDEVELAYVSDRNEQQTGALRDWLLEHDFLISEDAHVAATKDKRHWMRERKPEVVIDDRVRTMLMARYELGSYVVSLEHPHNMNLVNEAEHIYIVKDWEAIDTVLRETILPKLYEKQLSPSKEKRYSSVGA
jgi:hypothetical protein